MTRKTIIAWGSWISIPITVLALAFGFLGKAEAQSSRPQVQGFKVTILSTMLVGDTNGIGEWGFAALLDVDGHKILIDTGAHPDTVIRNAHDLHVDLSGVQELILTHNHWDHVSGVLTLRRELMKENRNALSVIHASEDIFSSRPSENGERNQMIALRKEYEATGGRFVVHSSGAELIPGVWFTGPIPRIYPEHNWTSSGKILTASGLVEDNIPEDSSVVLNSSKGLVIITGCGHAGIVNIATYAEKHFGNRPIYGVVGGLHLFASTDEVLAWTASKLREFQTANLLAAHCTGVEATFRLREELGLNRKTAVIATVGSSFSSASGIEVGPLAK
ncbi:MBL fold metallo-hydrolase [Terriglobus albidus]|uniref:MBL fold metallo-hydrolase n=1 Tax=Terriglobus albidus TaxID=1592106 RepID=UPI0021E08D37|nr:MBL fold metallo-hydrolase [Terriglobus albidus]